VGVLSERIENLRIERDGQTTATEKGWNECVSEASVIALEADELMADMAEALDGIMNAGATYAEAEAALHRYNQIKERAK